jgi:hypothetical protein
MIHFLAIENKALPATRLILYTVIPSRVKTKKICRLSKKIAHIWTEQAVCFVIFTGSNRMRIVTLPPVAARKSVIGFPVPEIA